MHDFSGSHSKQLRKNVAAVLDVLEDRAGCNRGSFRQKGAGLPASRAQPGCFGKKQANSSSECSPREKLNNSVFSFSGDPQCFLSLAVRDSRTVFPRARLEPFFPVLFAGGTWPATTGLSAGCMTPSARVTRSRIRWLLKLASGEQRVLGADRLQRAPGKSTRTQRGGGHAGLTSFLLVLLSERIETGTLVPKP